MTEVYVVVRESGDGLETDIFTDYDLAKKWARIVGTSVQTEPAIDAETLNAMVTSYLGEDDLELDATGRVRFKDGTLYHEV